MQVILNAHPVEVFTANYFVKGEMQMRGAPNIFLNDPLYPFFTVVGSVIRPLAQGTQIGAMNITRSYVPKETIEVLAMPEIDMDEIQIMKAKRPLICFTDTFVIRGDFHTGPETGPGDVFYFNAGPFFPATNVEVRAIRPVAAEVNGTFPLAFIHRDAVRVLYSQDEQAG